jgi:uncharacterized protein involved in oxidation of intracellular sulfur
MKTLAIGNDPRHGTERSRDGLWLATALARRDGADVRVLQPGDDAGCAVPGQKVPGGYCHLDRMIGSAARHRAEAGRCGTCLEARGITGEAGELAAGRQ